MKNEFLKTLNLLIIVSCSIHATDLSGDIGGMTLKKGDSPFVINSDVLISTEKRAVIEKGCVLLFKPFTGITIEGELIVNGTNEAPVVFTSYNDNNYNPSSKELPENFDWNGIIIQKESRSVRLSHFILHYSVFGIKSFKNAFTIVDGIFSNNGQFHLTIKDTMQKVMESTPYSYGLEYDTGDPSNVQKKNFTRIPGILRRLTPYVLGGTGVAALACGGYFFSKKEMYHSRYDNTRDQLLMDHNISQETVMRNRAVVFTTAGGILGVGSAGIFYYDLKLKRSTTLSLYSLPFASTGFNVILSF
jgi:hypothetical protein